MLTDARRHYDLLIAEGNDPVTDPPEMQAYMNRWDGEVFLRLLALDGRQTVLEIGVGTGRLALRTAPRCRDFTGIDLSPKTIECAGVHLAAYPHVRLICGDFLTAVFDGCFDVIYSSLTFLHIAQKAEAVRRMAELLNPGGRVILSLDKSMADTLDYGTRQLRVYPDDPQAIAACMTTAGLRLLPPQETEAAYIISAVKA